MKTMQRILAMGILFGMAGMLKAQCGSDINFSTDWAKKGPAAAGNWVVSGGGSTVTQTINGDPTFYVSGENYIDVVISGTFKVNTSNDDDWVGFVFGYQDPISPADNPNQHYYLFDWKQANQTGGTGECYGLASEGFSLVKVDTSISLTNTCAMRPLYWGHNSYPGFNVLATDYGGTRGWNDLTTYGFTLTYTSKLIVITINGDTIFNIPGCYEPGRFGFYNLSQDQAVYSNFSYQLVADFDFSTTDACMNEDVDFIAVNDACLTGPYVSPIQSWTWSLGDGTTMADPNVVHAYAEPGTYNVTLTVEDATGCQTPLTKPFVVKGLKAYQSQTIICPSTSTQIWCNHVQAGALYQWFRNGIAVTSPTVNDTTYNVTTTGNYHVEITGFGAYDCNTTSNTVTVTVETLNPVITSTGTSVCAGTPVNFNTSAITGAQYEWFVGGVSQGVGTNNFSTSATGAVYVEITTTNGCVFGSNTITLVTGTVPTASITSTVTGFCPGASADLSISLLAGETVQWYRNGTLIPGATGTSYTATLAGNYTAIVTNASGCTDESNTIAITIYSVPSASITAAQPNFCPGTSSILLTANTVAGATYSWAHNGSPLPGVSGNTYTATATGDYTVTITNASGCSTTSSITTLGTGSVSTFTLSPAASSFCDGSTVNISTMSETGSSYTWYNNGVAVAGPSTSLSSYNANAGGTYVVSVTNAAGCTTQSDTISLTEIPLPTAAITASTTSICTGSSSIITATFVAGATYEWFHNGVSLGAPAPGDNSMTAAAGGNYYVVVNDGCSNTSNTIAISTMTIPSAAGTVFGDNTFCPGESLIFDLLPVTGATSYYWTISPATAASIGSGQGTDEVVVNTTNQNFTITVTPQNACGNGTSKSKTVNVQTTPGWCLGIFFAANKTNICQGSSVTFTNYTDPMLFFGATANWNFGPGASPATATGNGPHTVTYSSSGLKTVTLSYVDNFSGMIIDSETKTAYINVNGTVSTSAISGNSSVACSSVAETYSVVNTPGSTYAWTVPTGASILSGAGTNSIQVNLNGNSGNISVTETTAAGCTGPVVSKTVTVTGVPSTSAITGNTSIICSSLLETYSVVNTPGSTYAWTVPAGATILGGAGTNSINVDFNGNMGTVSVIETNADGCTGAPVSVNVSCITSVESYTDAHRISIYPNPVSDVLTVTNHQGSAIEVMIYDLNGQQVLVSTSTGNTLQLNVSHLSRGTYVGKTVSNGSIGHFRFIKQ